MNRLLRSLFLLIVIAFVVAQNDDDFDDGDDGDDDGAQGGAQGGACTCPAVSDPVCGTDGETYDNRDCASCAGVQIACSGGCPCNNIACLCPVEGPQVCGTDGVTYGNECLAGCEGIAKLCDRSCPCDDDDDDDRRDPDDDDETIDDDDDFIPDCICALIYDPVCGFNQETYGNECVAKCSAAEIACETECPCGESDCICPEVLSPVCGIDGKSYGNECIARCVGVPISCNQDCECPCPEGLVNCIDDPCENAQCAAYPDATCYSNFCGGCNAIFAYKGEIVNCDVSLPACIPRGERCNAYAVRIDDIDDDADDNDDDIFFDGLQCCNDLQCCPDRCFDEDSVFDDDDGVPDNDDEFDDDEEVIVTSVFGTCRNNCACKKRR